MGLAGARPTTTLAGAWWVSKTRPTLPPAPPLHQTEPNIGSEPAGKGGFKPHKFRPGRDPSDARIRAIQLERCWEAVARRTGSGERALRDDLTLQIGQGLARGEPVVRLEGYKAVADDLYPRRTPHESRRPAPQGQGAPTGSGSELLRRLRGSVLTRR